MGEFRTPTCGADQAGTPRNRRRSPVMLTGSCPGDAGGCYTEGRQPSLRATAIRHDQQRTLACEVPACLLLELGTPVGHACLLSWMAVFGQQVRQEEPPGIPDLGSPKWPHNPKMTLQPNRDKQRDLPSQERPFRWSCAQVPACLALELDTPARHKLLLGSRQSNKDLRTTPPRDSRKHNRRQSDLK